MAPPRFRFLFKRVLVVLEGSGEAAVEAVRAGARTYYASYHAFLNSEGAAKEGSDVERVILNALERPNPARAVWAVIRRRLQATSPSNSSGLRTDLCVHLEALRTHPRVRASETSEDILLDTMDALSGYDENVSTPALSYH
jgi:hypothetical protein